MRGGVEFCARRAKCLVFGVIGRRAYGWLSWPGPGYETLALGRFHFALPLSFHLHNGLMPKECIFFTQAIDVGLNGGVRIG
jgi:hypothetical protein